LVENGLTCSGRLAYHDVFFVIDPFESEDMPMKRGVIALCVTVGLLFSTTLVAQNDKDKEKERKRPKLTNAQKADLATINQLIDGMAAGKPAPNDLSLTWVRDDVLKAEGGREYVPFTFTIDPAAASAKTLTVYWRVVSPTAAAPAAETAKPNPDQRDNKDQRESKAPPVFPFEDMNSTTVPAGASGPVRVGRAFAVPAGKYDVYLAVKEPTPERKQRDAPPQKVSLIKQTVEVPDLWNSGLNTSSVFVAEKIEPLQKPLTPEEQTERPYALGPIEIVPASDLTFAKSDDLQTFMIIYNAQTNAENKPDITVEYNFYTKEAGAEKHFNKTNPQDLNSKTLPPEFSFAAGHQLQAGQGVPLKSFPEGEYRLEIKITDKVAGKTITRDVNFKVTT
jgi:hypothetical protein